MGLSGQGVLTFSAMLRLFCSASSHSHSKRLTSEETPFVNKQKLWFIAHVNTFWTCALPRETSSLWLRERQYQAGVEESYGSDRDKKKYSDEYARLVRFSDSFSDNIRRSGNDYDIMYIPTHTDRVLAKRLTVLSFSSEGACEVEMLNQV